MSYNPRRYFGPKTPPVWAAHINIYPQQAVYPAPPSRGTITIEECLPGVQEEHLLLAQADPILAQEDLFVEIRLSKRSASCKAQKNAVRLCATPQKARSAVHGTPRRARAAIFANQCLRSPRYAVPHAPGGNPREQIAHNIFRIPIKH